MNTAEWALIISLGSLVMSDLSLFWNIWSKFIYPKPKVRVFISIMEVVPNPDKRPPGVSMTATNYGPSEVTLQMAIARRTRVPWSRQSGLVILRPLEGFPDLPDRTDSPFSGGLPKKMAVGERFPVYFPLAKAWISEYKLKRFDFIDTFGKHHWCSVTNCWYFRKSVLAEADKG